MIYKDAKSREDSLDIPADRGDKEMCLNCGMNWLWHNRWACADWRRLPGDDGWSFHAVPPNKRYLTRSMKESRADIGTVTCNQPAGSAGGSSDLDLSDWRTWAHKAPGDCPCGIKREACDFHR